MPAWPPDINFENMEINYLKQALASVVQSSTRADVYLRYLEKCDFNTTLEPHSIIKFSKGDVRIMVGIGQDSNGAEEVRQFKKKATQMQCKIVLKEFQLRTSSMFQITSHFCQ